MILREDPRYKRTASARNSRFTFDDLERQMTNQTPFPGLDVERKALTLHLSCLSHRKTTSVFSIVISHASVPLHRPVDIFLSCHRHA